MKYRIQSIDPSTYSITELIGGVHAYLLVGASSALLIDTGNGVGDLAGAVASITALPLTVVNTHAHLDHTNANHQFSAVRLPAGEEPIAALFGDKAAIRAAFRRMLPLPLRALVRLLVPQMITPTPYAGRFDLTDHTLLSLGGRTVEVVSVSGHTVRSVAFYDRDRNFLFSGDTLVDRTVLLNLPGSASIDAFAKSLQKLSALTDDATLIFPGHNKIPQDRTLLKRFVDCARFAVSVPAQTLLPDAPGAFDPTEMPGGSDAKINACDNLSAFSPAESLSADDPAKTNACEAPLDSAPPFSDGVFTDGSESGYPCRYAEACGVRIALPL